MASAHSDQGPLHSAQCRHPLRNHRQRCTKCSLRHRIGYNIINATGMFDVACRKWRGKPDANKTLINFRCHFRDADQDHRHSQTIASIAGYNGANAAAITAPATAYTPTPSAPSPALRGPDLRPNTPYCWSHGFLKNQKHNSQTCKFKKSRRRHGINQLAGAAGIFTLVPTRPQRLGQQADCPPIASILRDRRSN